MKANDHELSQRFSRTADDALRGSPRSSQAAREEILRRHRSRLTFQIVAAVVLVLVTAASAVLAVDAFQNDRGSGFRPAAQPTLSSDNELSPSPSPSSSADEGNSDEVFVYFMEMNQGAYDKDSYVARPRRARGEQDTQGRLRAALQELVKGPTSKEQNEGLLSMFSSETAHILREVEVTDTGRAIVNFEDFTDDIPQVSATEAGTIFIFQLNQTVFQFSAVNEIEYQIEGNCDAFWGTLESVCSLVEREEWETVE